MSLRAASGHLGFGPLGLWTPWALGPLGFWAPWALGTLGFGHLGPLVLWGHNIGQFSQVTFGLLGLWSAWPLWSLGFGGFLD